ncbi:YceI family protein [Glaciecola sp. MF2-115]|uniref:YceI family protein n=1 Tax=Glaciecola sp. MF2-115 TaxID=3384827 RepID=UPI0039A219BA
MNYLKIALFTFALSVAGCISWVFAKSPFSDMPEGNYTLDLSHASVVWRVSHFGLSNYVGRFTDFEATIDYSPSDISKSKISASINPMSIQTAYPNPEKEDFDNTLATSESWFNAKQFASINFVSTSVEMTGDTTAKMLGNLTFLGVTKPVTLDVKFNGAMQRQPLTGKATLGFSATTIIKRTDWGMTIYAPNIGDEVSVMIEGEFTKTDE